MSLAKIAKTLGVSQATISRQCKKYEPKRDPILTIVSNKEIIELTNLELSTYEIAKNYVFHRRTNDPARSD